jgi:hypothetical protein
VEVEYCRVVIHRWRVPGHKADAVGGCDLKFLNAIETSVGWGEAGWVGKVHEQAVAEKDHRADRGIDNHDPRNECYDVLLHSS